MLVSILTVMKMKSATRLEVIFMACKGKGGKKGSKGGTKKK